MKPIAAEINLTDKQEAYLSKLYCGSHTPLHFKQRSQIIIAAKQRNNKFSNSKEYGSKPQYSKKNGVTDGQNR